MQLTVNNQTISLPSEVKTVLDLLRHRELPEKGIGVAVNNKIIISKNWGETLLKEGDAITVISASYGG